MSSQAASKRKSIVGVFLKAILTIIIGFIGWCIWDAKISPRLSTYGEHTKHPAFLYTCINGNRSVRLVGFSPDGSRFLTRGNKRAVIHDTESGTKIAEARDHFKDYDFNVSGDRAVITARHRDRNSDRVVMKKFNWDGELIGTVSGEGETKFASIAMVPQLKGGFASSEDGRVIMRHADGKRITELPGGSGGIHLLCSANGDILASHRTGEPSVHVWQLRKIADPLNIDSGPLRQLVLSDDGKLLAGRDAKSIRVWNTQDGTLLSTLAAQAPEGHEFISLAISRDGSLLAAGTASGWIIVADADSGDERQRFNNELKPATMDFSANSDRIVAGLSHQARMSGGGRINHGPRAINQSSYRIDRTPGYAIGWSLSAPES